MKKYVLLVLINILLAKISFTQTFRVGVLAGASISDVDGIKLIDHDCSFKYGFSGGGFVNTKINSENIFQMEIAYVQKGSQQSPDSTNDNNYYKLQLNYVNITMLWKHQLHFGINNTHTDKYGFEGGVSCGALVYSLYTVKSVTQPGSFNSIDPSLLIGLYYNFTPNFYISCSYSNSFIPVIKRSNSLSITYPYYSSWNRGDNLAFQFTLGFTFGSSSSEARKKPSIDSETD